MLSAAGLPGPGARALWPTVQLDAGRICAEQLLPGAQDGRWGGGSASGSGVPIGCRLHIQSMMVMMVIGDCDAVSIRLYLCNYMRVFAIFIHC